jgi:hypothetical protein
MQRRDCRQNLPLGSLRYELHVLPAVPPCSAAWFVLHFVSLQGLELLAAAYMVAAACKVTRFRHRPAATRTAGLCMYCASCYACSPQLNHVRPSRLACPCSGQECSAGQSEFIKAIVSGAMLCNDSHLNHSVGPDSKEVWTPNGAPTEVSLITVGVKAGLTVEGLKAAEPRIASVPFESEHK